MFALFKHSLQQMKIAKSKKYNASIFLKDVLSLSLGIFKNFSKNEHNVEQFALHHKMCSLSLRLDTDIHVDYCFVFVVIHSEYKSYILF